LQIEKVLFTTEQLNEILDDLGRQIGADYSNKPLLVIGVLKGGFMFTADLIRHIHPVPPVMEV
jgi:hypoxanthine phosphoribosyltransferase